MATLSTSRLVAMVAKVETTYGTDVSPAGGTDDVTLLEDYAAALELVAPETLALEAFWRLDRSAELVTFFLIGAMFLKPQRWLRQEWRSRSPHQGVQPERSGPGPPRSPRRCERPRACSR